MRCLIPVAMAVLLSASAADAACTPAIGAPGSAVTMSGGTTNWVDIFFMPTGTVAFAVDTDGVNIWNYATATTAAATPIAGAGGTAWPAFGTGYTAAADTTGLAMGGGAMKADASSIILTAQAHYFTFATTSPYAITDIAGKPATAGCAAGDGFAAQFNGAYGTAFTSGAETQVLSAVRACSELSTVNLGTPFTVATVVGASATAGNQDGFGTSVQLTTPSGLAQWKDRFFLQSNAGIRISAVYPSHGWQVAAISVGGGGASSASVAFTALHMPSTLQGKVASINLWNNCWLSVYSDATANTWLVDPAADQAYIFTGSATGDFARLDPTGVAWIANGVNVEKKTIAYTGCAAANAVPSAHACKWPTASATIPLPKTRTPTMPVPKTRTMTYVAPPTTVAVTSAATSAAASTTAAAVVTTTAAAVATTTAAAAATTTVAAATTTAAAATTTAAAASSTTTTTAAASGSGASAVTCAVLSVMTFLACLM